MMSSAELLNLLYNAQTKEQIDVVVAAANRWLASYPHDEDVRLAHDQSKRRRLGAPPNGRRVSEKTGLSAI